MLYRLARPELLTVLAAAEPVLAATGNAVTLCRCTWTRASRQRTYEQP
jgi:hypothetical protein